jgi:HSP20 family protein
MFNPVNENDMNLIRRTGGFYPSFLEDFFDENWSGQASRADTGTRIPAVNVKEKEDNFEIQVAAPGMKRDDFKISIENNVLSISAEEKSENEEKDEKGNFTRREFSYSSFRRSFSLPVSIDADNINAKYDNGILKVELPKKEEAKPKSPKQIQVS